MEQEKRDSSLLDVDSPLLTKHGPPCLTGIRWRPVSLGGNGWSARSDILSLLKNSIAFLIMVKGSFAGNALWRAIELPIKWTACIGRARISDLPLCA